MAKDFAKGPHDPALTQALLIEWTASGLPGRALAGLIELDRHFAPVQLADGTSVIRAFPCRPDSAQQLRQTKGVKAVWQDSLLPALASPEDADSRAAGPRVGQWARPWQGRGQVISMLGTTDRMHQVLQSMAPMAACQHFGAGASTRPDGQISTGGVLQALSLAIHSHQSHGTPQVLLLGCDFSQSADFLPGTGHPLTTLLDQAVALGLVVVFAADGSSAALAMGGKGPQAMPLWLARTAGASAWADVLQLPDASDAATAAAMLAATCALLSCAVAATGQTLAPGALRSALVETAVDGEVRPLAALRHLQQRREMDAFDGDEDQQPYPLHARQPRVDLAEWPEALRRFEDHVGGQIPAQEPETDLLNRIHAAQAVLDHLVAQYRGQKGRVPALTDRL